MAQEIHDQISVRELTDEMAERLIELPEVQEEVRQLNSIKADYRAELMARIRDAQPSDKIPSVVDIKKKYGRLIERQENALYDVMIRFLNDVVA